MLTGTHVNVWQRLSCRIRLSLDELIGLSDTKFRLNQVRRSFPGPSLPTRTKSHSSAILSTLTVKRESGWRERMSPWCFSFSLISNRICPFCLVSFLHLSAVWLQRKIETYLLISSLVLVFRTSFGFSLLWNRFKAARPEDNRMCCNHRNITTWHLYF